MKWRKEGEGVEKRRKKRLKEKGLRGNGRGKDKERERKRDKKECGESRERGRREGKSSQQFTMSCLHAKLSACSKLAPIHVVYGRAREVTGG